MVTKEQALTCNIFHSAGGRNGKCRQWRRSGQTQVWKQSPERFKVPVKFGLYWSDYITEDNADQVHTAEECPNEK